VQAELFLHGFKLRRLRIRESDPDKAVGLVNIEMNLADRDIGKFATILISDTIDEHCGQSLYDVEIKRGPGRWMKKRLGGSPTTNAVWTFE
jgi:hypothetical protein